MITAGWISIAITAVCAVSVVSLVLLFVVGGPFGLINDIGNALIGLLSVALAVAVARQVGGGLGVALTVVGAAFAVYGSWLVMSGTTGFALAGFVSTIGFGFIGAWLALAAWSPVAAEWWGGSLLLVRIGAVAMIIGGLAAVPGALMRIDAYDNVPGWLWLFSFGWLGLYVLYPIATLVLGRRFPNL